MACTLPILILAAGASTRMRGRDKLLEEVQGKPLLQRQIEIATVATSGPVLVALPPAPHPRYALLKDTVAHPVPVPDAATGMSASLRRGLDALPLGATAVMVLLADLPELTADDLRAVCASVIKDGQTLIWRGATQTGAAGHPIVFDQVLFEPLKKIEGDTGGAEVVARYKDQMLLVPLPGERARLDLDTPEDWENWRSRKT